MDVPVKSAEPDRSRGLGPSTVAARGLPYIAACTFGEAIWVRYFQKSDVEPVPDGLASLLV